ncbi:MAG: hypothetical protein GWM98_01240 [Nitrospinaceae bacterium]|nr:hypothetical protein [Nitrospinaceae bacterium]NIY13598.1 hypothetical protein [Nitrospinaceae bacterium]
MQVKHLSRNAIDSIIENRKHGPYTSLADFMARVDIEEHEAASLIRCGALAECLHTQRADTPSCNQSHQAQMLWQLKRLMKRRSGSRNSDAPCLPGIMDRPIPSFPAFTIKPYSPQEKLWAELECLDLTVSEHLLALYGVTVADAPDGAAGTLILPETGRPAHKPWPRSILPVIAARHLSRHAGRLVTLAGWMITAKRTRTGRGELMKFMTLEDPTACFEVTLFPKIYRRFGALLYDRGPYIVRGRVEREGLCCTLTALWLGRVPGWKSE